MKLKKSMFMMGAVAGAVAVLMAAQKDFEVRMPGGSCGSTDGDVGHWG
jgi:hypothetical protein